MVSPLPLRPNNGCCPADVRLSGEAANAERDRQSYYDHVDQQALNQVVEFVGAASVESGERQHDKTHDLFHSGAKDQARHEWVLDQES